MDSTSIRIIGGVPLKGTVTISGAKNAALPLMAASLLSDEPLTLRNVPDIGDVQEFASLLMQYGVEIVHHRDSAVMTLHNKRNLRDQVATHCTWTHNTIRNIRVSILVLGPLIVRYGKAEVPLPSGCDIGERPVDLHIAGLRSMGAEINLRKDYVEGRNVSERLVGTRFTFPKVSVGATENLLMAATLARGETVLVNAAREPEIRDLAKCLIAMGADIKGIDSDCLIIQGVTSLHSANHRVMSDRIEAGTYAVAAAITGGSLILTPFDRGLLDNFYALLVKAGVTVTHLGHKAVEITAPKFPGRVQGVELETGPFPGFPTDLQAQFMALMCQASGTSKITEAVFENRFKHVPQLKRMGADIHVEDNLAVVRGVEHLTGAQVMSTDLRASACLVLAGLAARGETVVTHVDHLDRGYEKMVEKLRACGARIERVTATLCSPAESVHASHL